MMKKLSLFLTFLLFSSILFAQLRGGIGYDFNMANGEMGLYIRNIHNFKMEALYQIHETRWAFGLELGIGGYGSKRDPIVFTQNNITTNTFVKIDNMVYTTKIVTQANLFNGERKFMPYLHGGLGFNFFSTNLTIEDPLDVDACRPLQSNVLASDHAWVGNAGLGVRWEAYLDNNYKFYVDLRGSYASGGNVSYMSLNPPLAGSHSHNTNNNSFDSGSPVNVDFQSPVNNNVHQHTVGRIYNTPINYLSLQLMLGFSF